MAFKVITFKIGGVPFALDINSVESVVELESITKIPDAPYEIEGVMNLRGEILPIIDGRKKFGEGMGNGEGEKVIVVNFENTKYGLIVDTVDEVMNVSEEEVEEVMVTKASYVSGIIKKGGDLIVLLNPDIVGKEVLQSILRVKRGGAEVDK